MSDRLDCSCVTSAAVEGAPGGGGGSVVIGGGRGGPTCRTGPAGSVRGKGSSEGNGSEEEATRAAGRGGGPLLSPNPATFNEAPALGRIGEEARACQHTSQPHVVTTHHKPSLKRAAREENLVTARPGRGATPACGNSRVRRSGREGGPAVAQTQRNVPIMREQPAGREGGGGHAPDMRSCGYGEGCERAARTTYR